jgi:hypothetical protein
MTNAVTTAAPANLFGVTDRTIRDLARRGLIGEIDSEVREALTQTGSPL